MAAPPPYPPSLAGEGSTIGHEETFGPSEWIDSTGIVNVYTRRSGNPGDSSGRGVNNRGRSAVKQLVTTSMIVALVVAVAQLSGAEEDTSTINAMSLGYRQSRVLMRNGDLERRIETGSSGNRVGDFGGS